MPKASVTWVADKQFVAETGSGHALVLDTGAEIGGRNTGPTPMELLLVSLAGCTAVDVAYIFGDRMRQTLTGLSVAVEGIRAEEPPKVYTEITVRYTVRGRQIQPKKAVRAIRLSAQNFCSVSLMVKETARVTSHYEIFDEASGERLSGTLEEE